MSATAASPSSALTIGASLAAAALLVLMPVVAILSVLIGHRTCADAAVEASPTTAAERGVPSGYLTLYRHAGRQYGVPWPVLAGIGAIETDHGRSRAPGVRSGVNSYGCCAGPMQFNLRDGPPSTWDRYGVDGNRDGTRDVYDPADAIASAAHYLRALLRNAGGNIAQAVLGYNHSRAYVNDVLARARVYADLSDRDLSVPGDPSSMAGCAGGIGAVGGPASVGVAERVSSPRAYRALPRWALAAGTGSAAVDARIHDDVVWILRRYRLRVTAAREAGHRTHGDGTAVDLVPSDGTTQAVWDASAGRLAHDLGWSPACGRSGTRPVCHLVPAIQFVGYDGYPGHGSPRTCGDGCPAHLHISWVSPCYGTSGLSPPCEWVMSFPAPAGSDAELTTFHPHTRAALHERVGALHRDVQSPAPYRPPQASKRVDVAWRKVVKFRQRRARFSRWTRSALGAVAAAVSTAAEAFRLPRVSAHAGVQPLSRRLAAGRTLTPSRRGRGQAPSPGCACASRPPRFAGARHRRSATAARSHRACPSCRVRRGLRERSPCAECLRRPTVSRAATGW